ncbi:MAG: hypothetical protein ACOZCO_13710 [Bacteroidota bacterium]
MRKWILLVLLLRSVCGNAYHVHGGELTYQWLGGNTYEFKATFYADTTSFSSSPLMEICYGDGQCDTAVGSVISSNGSVVKSEYTSVHVYSGPGTYIANFQWPNWASGIINIQNSVNVGFISYTTLYISPFLSGNSSPLLTTEHWDVSFNPGTIFHTVAPTDPDGDSLVFSFVPCSDMALGIVYEYPDVIAGGTSWIDQNSGSWYFYNLQINGTYAVNFRIEEYRNSVLVGYVERQMVFDWVVTGVDETENTLPVSFSQDEHGLYVNAEEIISSFSVYDMSGRLLMNEKHTGSSSLTIPVLAPAFIVEVTTVNGQRITRPFVSR